jgi:protein-L-isoaspartate(D-aspartate) O-methyltransferase
MAALLGVHAAHVWTIEIDPQLAATARENLRRAGVTNVTVETGNGLSGLAARAPFDVIVVSGAIAAVPEVLLDQLKPGGRLFAIEGAAPAMAAERGVSRLAVFETAAAPLTDAEPAPAFAF